MTATSTNDAPRAGASETEALVTRYRRGTAAAHPLAVVDVQRIAGEACFSPGLLTQVDGVTTLDRPIAQRLLFLESFDEQRLATLRALPPQLVLVVATPAYADCTHLPLILTETPRLTYARIVEALFDYEGSYWRQQGTIDPTAVIDPTAWLGPNVSIGRNTRIGAGCRIAANVVIGPNCVIGARCVIKSGTVIGQPGFGVFRDPAGVPHHFPHVAGVVLEEDVEIGALNTVCAGSIHPTVVGRAVKTDDHVHIAHNCIVGPRTLLTACAEVSGSVVIGADCWLGPNCTVRDGLSIGDKAFIGIGSNVTKAVAPNGVVAGNPARPLRPQGD